MTSPRRQGSHSGAVRRRRSCQESSCHDDYGGELSPAREPGGTLQRLTRSLPDAAWPVEFTTELATDADLPVMIAASSRAQNAR